MKAQIGRNLQLLKFFKYVFQVCNYDEFAQFLLLFKRFFLVWCEKGDDPDPDP